MKIKKNIFKNILKKKYILFILFILLILFLLYTFFFKKYIENFDNKKNTIIIARYKEDISYLLNDEFKNYHIIIYNKGDEITNQEIINKCKIIQLPNVGKCDHTYLHHIIENYENISNVTVFLPASFYLMDYKKARGLKVIEKVNETNNTVFPVTNVGSSVLETDYLNNFALDEWKTSFGNNQDSNTNYKTKLSPERPYGKWYEKHFPNNKCPYVCYMGIFAISKKDIHKNPIEKYKTLISYVDDDLNPEAGHFIERAWVSLFYPLDESCIYTDF